MQDAILDVIDGNLNIKDSTSSDHFNRIMRHAPIIAHALLNNTISGKLNEYVASIIKFILLHINKLYGKYNIPGKDRYGMPHESKYEFFPGFPVILGQANYEMDKTTITDDHFCRKLSGSHPVLSPGIFTVFCRHRVCLGFSLMTSSESPKTPFNIFLHRFSNNLPQMRIVYDNSCNLQQYCLNREMARFSETIFLIDRLHYADHTACTEGYNANAYNSDPAVKTLNTQTNEQANAELRHLTKQISYMKPENVMTLVKIFFAERNRRVKGLQ